MANKMCQICGANPATIPDRECGGRIINKVCTSCHGLRLAGDTKRILALAAERRRKADQIGRKD